MKAKYRRNIMKLTKCAPVVRNDFYDRLNWGFPVLQRVLGDLAETGDANGAAPLRHPRTNILEEENSFVFTMEMPGLTRENVEVQLEDDRLVIKGEAAKETEEKGMIRREYSSARFERTFNLGTDIDSEKISAKMENGVLTVTLPKKPEKLGRRVEIA